MSRRSPLLPLLLCFAMAFAGGCTPQQPFYFGDDGDLSHYEGVATQMEVPDVDVRPLDEVCGASAPLTLASPGDVQMWDLELEEAVHHALANSKVMRNLGVSLQAPEALTRGPDGVATVYDPARVESNPRFGVEAALSAFDAQFTTNLFWEKIDRPMNVAGIGQLFMARVDQQDLGTFQSRLAKMNATGGMTAINYNAYYNNSNSPTREWPSDWNTDVTAEFRQPLFQGAGVQFNRIAGPGAIPGYNNGVVIARIQTDIALADFENSVRVFVRDVEQAYWTLYQAYRELDAVVAGRDAALATWRRVKALQEQGAKGGEADQEAQARGQYWLFVAEMEQRRSNVFAAEAQLRYMMGLAVADGRQIRPSQEPTPAKVSFDWREAMCEAMARNVDLRRQKWRVKERELELISAKNYLLPQLDAVGQYRFRGLGDDFWYANRTGNQFGTAMENLTGGDYQDWRFGLELSLPIGFRKEMAGVRHAQLNLARERELLREQELEVTHQLANAIRDTELGIQLIRDNYEYSVATKHEVSAVKIAYETGTTTLNVLLEAQRRAAEAEVAYYRSLVNYNLSIVDVHYRKGSLLEYNGIWLAEGPWAGKAYFDARRRAQARDAGIYMNYGFTRPKVISRGEYQQQVGPGFSVMPSDDGMQPGDTMMFEEIHAPRPEGASMPVRGADAYSTGAIGPRLSQAARTRDTIAQKAAALFGGFGADEASLETNSNRQVVDYGVQPVNYDAEPAEAVQSQTSADPVPQAPIPVATPQWKSRTQTADQGAANDAQSGWTASQQAAPRLLNAPAAKPLSGWQAK